MRHTAGYSLFDCRRYEGDSEEREVDAVKNKLSQQSSSSSSSSSCHEVFDLEILPV